MNADVATPLPVLADRELTALDRCDRCGAQAWVRAVFAAGELLFCVHHTREHRDGLLGQAQHLDDQSHRMP